MVVKLRKETKVFDGKDGNPFEWVKYILTIDGIDIQIKPDETGKQLIDRELDKVK